MGIIMGFIIAVYVVMMVTAYFSHIRIGIVNVNQAVKSIKVFF